LRKNKQISLEIVIIYAVFAFVWTILTILSIIKESRIDLLIIMKILATVGYTISFIISLYRYCAEKDNEE
jgi:hypothetical protein